MGVVFARFFQKSAVALALALVILVAYKGMMRAQQPVHVHCLMMTGKDEARINFARSSVANFLRQTHQHKRLIIVNEHPTLRVLADSGPVGGVEEIVYDRSTGGTLGGMRNTALDMVPDGEMWITWDDDDYRHETFLSSLVAVAEARGADAVFHTRRFEHNLNTGFTWGHERRDGFWIVLCRKAPGVRYRELDANEDRDIREQIRTACPRWVVWENDPHLYIRTIHGLNTNTTVSPAKRQLSGANDFPVSEEDRRYVLQKLQGFFGKRV